MAVYTTEALAAEINTDPLAIGYKTNGVWKGDQEIADLLNAKNYTANKSYIKTADLRAMTTYAAYDGLTATEESWLNWITQGDEIAVTTDSLINLAGIGGASKWAAATRAVMEAKCQSLMQYQGSRAEVLWGEGFQVGAGMVGQAANV